MTKVFTSLDTGAVIKPQDFYDGLGMRYEENYGHDPGFHKIVQRFLSLLPPNITVLDVGCGTGKPVSSMIAESGRRPYGIDLSPVMVELSKKQVPKGTFQQCDMLHFTPSSPARFGAATALFSMFELSRAELTLMAQRFFQWIQPGGFLLIAVIGAEDLDATKPEHYDEDGECAHGIEENFMAHKLFVTLFTKSGWNKLLESVGFEIVHTETQSFVAPASARSDEFLYYYVIAKKPAS